MLQSDPNAPNAESRRYRPPSALTITLLTLAVIGVIVLRLDWYNWHTPRPLLLGIIPVGLWWQVMVSLAACATMWLLVTFAWPGHLEQETEHAPTDRDSENSPR